VELLKPFLLFSGVFLALVATAGVMLYAFYGKQLGQICFKLSCYYFEKQRFTQALFWMEHAFRLQPTHAPMLFKMGLVHQELGHFNQALDYFYLAQLQNPDNATYAYNIGVVEYDLGYYEVAISHWFNALQHADVVDVDIYYCIGAAYEALNNWPAAIEVYRQALDVSPDHKEILYSLASSLLEGGDLDASLSHTTQYVGAYDSVEGYNLLCLIHFENGNTEQALEAVQCALAKDPDNAEAINNFAVLQTQQLYSSLDESIQQLRQISPTDATTRLISRYNLMVMQGLNNHYADANITLGELLKQPMDERIQSSIAQAKLIIRHIVN
jgi:tetratricopeptide (TPR) repeat protein